MFRLLEVCDGNTSLRNEAWGALTFVASISAAHLTDYVVAPGMVWMVAPGRAAELIKIWIKAGLAEEIKVDDRPMIRIIEHEELLHMRTKEEVTIDRLRKSDGRKPELMIPVRVRDGDQCRFCGKTVKWGDQKSNRGATIDSLTGHVDSTVETLVVACRECNTKRGNGIELALRPVPTDQEVYYSDKTITYINDSDWARENGITVRPRQLRLDLPTAAANAGDATAAPFVEAPTASSGSEAPSDVARADASSSAARGSDNVADAPDWVTAPMSEVLGSNNSAPATAAPFVEAPTASSGSEAPSDVARAVSSVEASQARPAQDNATQAVNKPPGGEQLKASSGQGNHISHIEPELSRDPNQRGDGSRFVGSGRDGSGRAGPGLDGSVSARARRRRRGRRGKGS
ncbi:hypothetical protein WG936_05415 [Corynebacterium sp. H127]|uniref:HNH endonuclease n=1 Tax=Corynebacterium sp. H127 TaxID=3133418 RepID=UPI0030B6CE55